MAACGGSSEPGAASETETAESEEEAAATTAAPPATPAPATTVSPVPTSFADVQPAVVQIVAQGTFRDPEIGLSNGSGSGSGFIISPDGLAVTNNHVVAGAATLEVFVGGASEGLNATILGVSECNDLALIDINESEPLPYLEWFEGDISAGLDVYAAGFPLGDPEFTLTRGIVSKARAGGDLTGTSSIDHTIEHDANIQPGNSGGPLVSDDGRIVGVNYAGGAVAGTTAQFFAIASDLALPVVDTLRDGDFETLGINGWAVNDAEAGISGIWVAGVSAGSPASATGILPGDIVTSMNGLPVGTDGTMRDYCDVIRTAGDNPMSVEVLRFDTSEVLRGELNGDLQLETSFSFADEVVQESEVGTVASASYVGYQVVVDDQQQIQVEVPLEWSDIETEPFIDDRGVAFASLRASPSLSDFDDTGDAPGLWFLKFDQFLPASTVLTSVTEEFDDRCVDNGREDFEDALFSGQFQVLSECDGKDNAILVLVLAPPDESFTFTIIMQLVTEADLEALDVVFDTFRIL